MWTAPVQKPLFIKPFYISTISWCTHLLTQTLLRRKNEARRLNSQGVPSPPNLWYIKVCSSSRFLSSQVLCFFSLFLLVLLSFFSFVLFLSWTIIYLVLRPAYGLFSNIHLLHFRRAGTLFCTQRLVPSMEPHSSVGPSTWQTASFETPVRLSPR